jgi:hypothetical protein
MNDDGVPVAAVRIGQFLLAAERVTSGLVFIVDDARFEVIGEHRRRSVHRDHPGSERTAKRTAERPPPP